MRITSLKFPHLQPVFDVAATIRLSVFLLLCFILGGTSQDIVAPKLVLYLTSLIVIGCCLSVVKRDSLIWKLKALLIIWGVFFVVHLIYLIPVPPSIWSNLNGREIVTEGFNILGSELPWLPLSVTPEKTLFSLFDFLPPLAVILLMGTVVTVREFHTALWSLGAFVIISVILGMIQVLGVDEETYFYDITNYGSAVGFFSNANHYGVFLLMTIPLIACLADFNRVRFYRGNRGPLAFCMVAILAALLGIGLSGSLGGYLLIIPVLAATLFIWSSAVKKKQIYLIGIFVSLVAALLFDMFIWNDMESELSSKFTSIDTSTRKIMFDDTVQIAKNFFPIGSGPGSFSEVYRLVEEVGRKTVPHSHNDYIEIVAEFGLIGIAGLILTLIWLGNNLLFSIFAKGKIHNSAKFMSIAIFTILVYSVFDFSLRTIAVLVLAVFAVCSLVLSNKNITD